MRRLLLIRHGMIDGNAEGRYVADRDAQLNALGRRQVEQTAIMLAEHPIELIITSPMWRCLQTVAAIQAAREDEPTVRTDERLEEIHLGAFEGHTREELEELGMGDDFRAWRQGDPPVFPPGGETFESVAARLASLWAEITTGEERFVAVVGHSHTLRILLTRFVIGAPAEAHRRLYLDHASVSSVVWEADIPRIETLNLHGGHLPDLREPLIPPLTRRAHGPVG